MLWVWSFLALTGCTCEADGGASASTSAPATPSDPSVPGAADPSGAAAVDEPSPNGTDNGASAAERPAIDPEEARRVRALLRDGRRLSHAGQHGAALSKLEEALVIAPSPGLQCEAGFVAHRAGEHARARSLIERALHVLAERTPSESGRVPLAMCLYNAGLVYEEANEPARALDAYTRSLALRPHPTVQEHADSMRARVASAAPAPPRNALGVFTAASSAEIDRRVVTAFCQDAGLDGCVLGVGDGNETADSAEIDDDAPPVVFLQSQAPEGVARGLDARIVQASAEWDDYAYLIVSVGEHHVGGQIAYAYNPGAFGIGGGLTIDQLSYEDVIEGGPVEVVAVGTTSQYDMDMGGCEASGETKRVFVVCTSDGQAPRCASVLLESTSGYGAEDLEGCDEMYEDGNSRPEDEYHGYAFTYEIEAGALVLTSERAIDPPPISAGRIPFTTLLAADARRWP